MGVAIIDRIHFTFPAKSELGLPRFLLEQIPPKV
jgi:hypothetical protein